MRPMRKMPKNENTLKTLGSVSHTELGFHREVSLGDMCCILYNEGCAAHMALVDKLKRSDASGGCGPFVGVTPLLGHTKIESTVRYLGVEVDDALDIAEHVEV